MKEKNFEENAIKRKTMKSKKIILPRGLRKYGKQVKILGEGSYAVVYMYKRGSRKYAVKTMRSRPDDMGIHPTSLREAVISREVNHPGVVHVYEIIPEGVRKIHIVMELADSDLNSVAIEKRLFVNKPEIIKKIIYQLVRTLAYLHSEHIWHRDLKPHNILYFKKNNRVAITDFGLSRSSVVVNTNLSYEWSGRLFSFNLACASCPKRCSQKF